MKGSGYTLIEVLITIAIIAVLALVAIPITGRWVQSADLEKTEAVLIEAVGRAKASGLRNVSGATGDGYASIVCISTISNTLTVMESTSATAATCAVNNTATKLWQTKLDDDVVIEDGSSNAVSCLCSNNKGILVKPGTGTCSSCFNGNTLLVKTGSKQENVFIY